MCDTAVASSLAHQTSRSLLVEGTIYTRKWSTSRAAVKGFRLLAYTHNIKLPNNCMYMNTCQASLPRGQSGANMSLADRHDALVADNTALSCTAHCMKLGTQTSLLTSLTICSGGLSVFSPPSMTHPPGVVLHPIKRPVSSRSYANLNMSYPV